MNPYIRLPKAPLVRGREEPILALCKGKRVLHLGCVDAGLLHERFRRGELMHQKLASVASQLWGMDIDEAGIAFLRSQGFDNLVVGDICRLDRIEALRDNEFDVIVASEVIEHLQNPGLFLSAVKAAMTPGQTDLVVTVPNAFRLDTLIWLLRGVEFVHPDHNYWFSYHTATNLLRKNSFQIQRVAVYSFQPSSVLPNGIRRAFRKRAGSLMASSISVSDPTAASIPVQQRVIAYLRTLPKRLAAAFLYRRTPFWGDGIIVVARLEENASF